MGSSKEIIVSGMRPTGRLHLGNYFGALKNWVDLQDKYRCYYFVADLHALTTAYDRADAIAQNSRDMVIDWLSAGLDASKCTIFVQSHVPEVAELNTLLGMITPLGGLLRAPTFKEQLEEIFEKKYAGQMDIRDEQGIPQTHAEKICKLAQQQLLELADFGFLGYPVLMATDILLQSGDYVPVGQDQVVHIEIARDIARRFNDVYKENALKEPKPLLTKIPKVPGLDNRKMSKSYGNTIELGDDVESVQKKVMSMFTDPNKKRATDPGNPEGCTVYAFHKIYNQNAAAVEAACKAGETGCVACKKQLFELMRPEIEKFSAARKVYAGDIAQVEKILKTGAQAARENAQPLLKKVKTLMKLLQ